MLGALAGVPLGVTIITSIGTDLARAMIALFVLAMHNVVVGYFASAPLYDAMTQGDLDALAEYLLSLR